jgi:TRAP-type transport system periplasmic protein
VKRNVQHRTSNSADSSRKGARGAGGTPALLCGIICLLLLVLSCGQRDSGQVTIRIASVLPEAHPSSQALIFFKERLEELSEGEVRVRLFLNSQLGNDTETAKMCQMGNIEAAYVSTATMSQFIPALHALSMPFIFRDREHGHAVVDGPVGDVFREKLEKIDLIALAFPDAGTRNIMTKRGPITRPEQLSGLKIRVMPSPLLVDTINALGASAISIPSGEIYTALQTGVIDGWENNPQTTASFRMYETGCIYYAHTEHLRIPDLFIMNMAFRDRLEPRVREWLDQATRETVQHQRALWQESEIETIEQLKAAGMRFNEVDVSLFRARVNGVYEKYYARHGPEFEAICRQIIEMD